MENSSYIPIREHVYQKWKRPTDIIIQLDHIDYTALNKGETPATCSSYK